MFRFGHSASREKEEEGGFNVLAVKFASGRVGKQARRGRGIYVFLRCEHASRADVTEESSWSG